MISGYKGRFDSQEVKTKRDINEELVMKEYLQFISNQCALDVSVISEKPEVHPKIFWW